MMPKRLRVVAVMTHPVQYLSPWFRHIHASAPALDFKVVYATEATATQQGVGFGRSFEWDVPLREGYESIVVKATAEAASLHSDDFFGLDVPEIGAVVRKLDPHVVLLTGWHSITQVRALVAMRRAGIPVLYRGDTHLTSGSRRLRWLSQARARLMLRQFSGYLAVGSRSREYLRAMGVADPSIVASPHAVDSDWFRARAADARRLRGEIRADLRFSAAERVILYAGKLTAIKRPSDVIDAAAGVENGAVLFVGDGSERSALEATARARGVHAVFAGFRNQEEMPAAFVAADALLVPGRETWGLVANEALACDLPVVISSDAGAAPDLVAANACIAVPPSDAAQAACALTALIAVRDEANADQVASARAACQAVVDRCSFDAATRGLVTAATGVARNAQSPSERARARVVALCGNLVFAGGMERISFEALAAVCRGGGEVHALLNAWSSRPIAELAEQAGVTWQVGHYNARLDGVLQHPARLLRALGDVVMASAQLTRLIVRRHVTHVFAVDFRAVLVHAPALAFCALLGVPVVLRSGVAPTRSRLHRWLWRGMIRPLIARHVANSEFTAREVRDAGIPADRIVTIYNVAPARPVTARESVAREPGVIAYVGQIIPEKGVLQLLDAVGLLVARGHHVRLDIAGQMTGWAPDAVHAYRERVLARAAQVDLAGRVRFLGWCEDVETVLQRASVHCCPSQAAQREGFGITVVEAKRAGLPSVVCPSGALPELVEHERDGWIASGFDAVSIAEGLEWLLSDATRLEAAQHAALESSRRFDRIGFERLWQQQFGLRSPRSASVPESTGALAGARGSVP
jgi:glycosyltransferase involved in cell wall biosynthesis